MALINGIICKMSWFRKKYIVEFPKVSDETRDSILEFISKTISDTAAKSIAETVKENRE